MPMTFWHRRLLMLSEGRNRVDQGAVEGQRERDTRMAAEGCAGWPPRAAPKPLRIDPPGVIVARLQAAARRFSSVASSGPK